MRIATLLFALLAFPDVLSAQAVRVPPPLRPYVTVDHPVVALVDVRVIDGTGSRAVSGQTVIIRDGRIAALGPVRDVTVPEYAHVMNLEGRTVLPGFVMLHEHLFYPAGQAAYNQQEYSFPRLYLAGGVTTMRTGGSRDPYGDLNLKDAIDAGRVPGPAIHVTAPYLNGPGLPILFVHALDGPDDARRMVAFWAEEGATSFKAYMHISRAALGAAIDEAHRRGLKVTGHLCSVTYWEAAELGIDNLEHGVYAATDFVRDKEPDQCPSGASRTASLNDLDPNGPEAQRLIAHLVEHEVALTSTLTVFETSVPGRPVAPPEALDAMSSQARDQYLRTWSTIQRGPPDAARRFAAAMAFERAFAEAGGLLVAGTDPTGYGGVVAGYANHRLVELLVEAGFTPEGAIRIATLNGASYLDIEDQVGTIAAGKQADLIVVNGNPAARIEDIRRVETVFKRGLGFDSGRLFESVQGTVGIR